MYQSETVDAAAKEKLHKYGIKDCDIIAAVKCDMESPVKFGYTWVIALKNGICSLSGNGTYIFRDYNEIDEIEPETYSSSNCIVIRNSTGEIRIASFTFEVSENVAEFIKYAKKKISADINEEEYTSFHYNKKDYMTKGRKKLFLRLLSYIPRYKKSMIIMLLLVVAASIVNLINPYLTGQILYDEVLTPNGKYSGMLWQLVLLIITISAVNVVLGIIHGRIGADMSGKIIFDIKTEVFEAMQRLSMSFFTSKRTGNLMNRVNSDALDIQYFLNDGVPAFIINGLTICGVSMVLFITNPTLSVSVLVPVPIIAFLIKKSSRIFKKLKWKTWRSSSHLNSVINDTLAGERVVKAFGREDSEIARFQTASKLLYENKLREGIASAKVFPLINWFMTIGGLFVWSIGGGQVLKGSLTFGELMSFVGYLALLYNPVKFMVTTFDWWTSCMNSAQRIFEVIDTQPEITDSETPAELESINGNIEFRNVSFSYEPNKLVLNNVSFSVNKGEMIGLVGHSGAGKSTITNLVTRLYDVNDGEVLIDGINIKNISLKKLRSSIGMVLQETFLFSGSIAENIAYGNPGATYDEIVLAAKKANAHTFITNLPDGYETEIGIRGVNLSGGEKQRISIARAILMNPAILILDEATSSLDTETEKQIQQAIENLIKDRTTIAIAHRLSTLKNADKLVVVKEGKVAETGTHEELFNKEGGIYSSMAKKQLEAFEKRGAIAD